MDGMFWQAEEGLAMEDLFSLHLVGEFSVNVPNCYAADLL